MIKFLKVLKTKKEMVFNQINELTEIIFSGNKLPMNYCEENISKIFIENGILYAQVRLSVEAFRRVIYDESAGIVENSPEFQNFLLGLSSNKSKEKSFQEISL